MAYALFAVNRGLSNPEADDIRRKFEAQFGTDTKLDKDNPHHMKFIFEKASQRADVFKISGVSYMLTMGVVKHIIPAVASTNAVIAAACVNEAFKALSWCSQSLNSYFMYNGTTGVYTHTFEYGKPSLDGSYSISLALLTQCFKERKSGCPVCDPSEIRIQISPKATLKDLIDRLTADPALQLAKPSLAKPGLSLYMQKPEALKKATEKNLEKQLDQLIENNDVLTVTDPVYPAGTRLDVVVHFV